MIIFMKQGAGKQAVITLSVIGGVIIAAYIIYEIWKKIKQRQWLAVHPDVSRVFLMYEPGARKITYIDVYAVDGKAPQFFGSNYSFVDRGIYLTPGMHMVELECKITGTWNQGHNRNYGREVLEIEVGKNEDYRCIYDKDTHEYYLRIEA